MNFYNEYKWCRKCNRYVHFLLAVEHSYCIHCDNRVLLFNKEDLKKFHLSPILVE